MTLFRRKSITYSFFFELYILFHGIAVLAFFSYGGYKIYQYQNTINQQKQEIATLKSECPEIRLGRTLLKSNVIEEKNNTHRCLYDINEYMIYTDNKRKNYYKRKEDLK